MTFPEQAPEPARATIADRISGLLAPLRANPIAAPIYYGQQLGGALGITDELEATGTAIGAGIRPVYQAATGIGTTLKFLPLIVGGAALMWGIGQVRKG